MRSLALVIVAVILSGCVSKKSYDALLNENAQLETDRAALLKRLSSNEMKQVEVLEAQLSSCSQRVTDAKRAGEVLATTAEQKGYYQGAADFNASLQVIGAPRSTGWWIFGEHYYTFQVSLRGHPLYSMTVETEEELPPVLQGLALAIELQEALPFRPSARLGRADAN